jgi:aldose 1-epimerase
MIMPCRLTTAWILVFLAVICLSRSTLSMSSLAAEISVVASPFGTTSTGQSVQQFRLTNSHGDVARIVEYGATIVEWSVPDKDGARSSIVLGSDKLADYEGRFPAASVIGRYANRIRNARFELDGKTVEIVKNMGQHHIHGGSKHFGKVLWKGQIVPDTKRATVRMVYVSQDAEEGFPGKLTVIVTYALTDDRELRIDYQAITDQPTVVNLTNHAYFHLGKPGTDILNHEMQIDADQYTLVDELLIPTGQLANVQGTPLDFRSPKVIGQRIEQLYEAAKGYDHNYVLRGSGDELRRAAKVRDPSTGRVLECWTTQPGVQFYSSNWFNGQPFPKHGAFCLETQHFPDSPNQPNFPSTVVRPDKPFQSTTVFKSSVEK